jgi:SAM-dependent methyltransferase
MADDPDLNRAYALETPEDTRRLYREWAETYETGFVAENDYVLHLEVARHFALIGGFGPVLDVGAGTGLCGAALRARGIEPIDGTDISPEMLREARQKGMYRDLFTGNILEGINAPGAPYQGAVSSGTFTDGHVGPDGIDAVLDVVRPGGWIVLSVNSRHYAAKGFEARIEQLSGRITDLGTTRVAIYGPKAEGEHADDTAELLAFRAA